MQTKQILSQGWLVLITPLVTSWNLATLPSHAATLSYAEAAVTVDNFSHTPVNTTTLTVTNTYAIARSGAVISESLASAYFNNLLPFAENLSVSQGAGNIYWGMGQSVAAIVGHNFSIGKGETFSFDFYAALGLLTAVDYPNEYASATGNIIFQLYNSTNPNHWKLLDSFQLSGNLTASGTNRYLSYGNSYSIRFNPNQTYFNTDFSGNQESVFADISGYYSRTFHKSTQLTLVEFQENQTEVEAVPEPLNILGSLGFGLVCFGRKIKDKLFPLSKSKNPQ
mgnify:CR=1 FL=1